MDWPVFMTGTTETWRKGRKLLDRSLRPGAIVSYRQMIQEKTREFLAQLRATPKDFEAHVGLSVVDYPPHRMTVNGQAAFKGNFSCHSRTATI